MKAKGALLLVANLFLWSFQGLYTVSPIDLIPDVIPLIGLADDTVGLLVAIGFALYTVASLWKQRRPALTVDAPRVRAREVIDYEPMSLDEIRAL